MFFVLVVFFFIFKHVSGSFSCLTECCKCFLDYDTSPDCFLWTYLKHGSLFLSLEGPKLHPTVLWPLEPILGNSIYNMKYFTTNF